MGGRRLPASLAQRRASQPAEDPARGADHAGARPAGAAEHGERTARLFTEAGLAALRQGHAAVSRYPRPTERQLGEVYWRSDAFDRLRSAPPVDQPIRRATTKRVWEIALVGADTWLPSAGADFDLTALALQSFDVALELSLLGSLGLQSFLIGQKEPCRSQPLPQLHTPFR